MPSRRSLLPAVVLLGVAAVPLPAAASVTGPLAGFADADLVQLEAVTLPAGCGDESLGLLGAAVACEFGLANVVVGDTEARVHSGAAIEYDGDTGLTAYGHGSNLDVDLLTVGGTVGTISQDLVVRSDARQPGGEAVDSQQLLALPANPVLGLEVATTEAAAVDVGTGNASCPEVVDGRATLARGFNELVGLRLLPDALGDGADLVGTVNPEGVSYAESHIELVDALVGGPSDGVFGVAATSTVQLAPVTLFGGAVTVEVARPELVVTHDGTGTTTSYETPIVTINGETVVDGASIEVLDALDVPLSPVLTLEVGIADAQDVVVDGTVATVTGVVTLDLVVGDTLGVASLVIGDLTAGATAPAGGVSIEDCDVVAGAPDPAPASAPAPDPDPAPAPEPTPTLPNTGGGAALAALLALGLGVGLRRRRSA